MRSEAIEDNLDEVQAWLSRDGFDVRGVEDPHSHRTLEATRARDYAYWLVHPHADADHVHVCVSIPGEAIEDALDDVPEDEVALILEDLRFGMLGMDVEFDGLERASEDVTLFVPAYFDGLSKDRFMEKVRAVKNAALFVEWSIAPPEEAPERRPEPGGDRYIR